MFYIIDCDRDIIMFFIFFSLSYKKSVWIGNRILSFCGFEWNIFPGKNVMDEIEKNKIKTCSDANVNNPTRILACHFPWNVRKLWKKM